MLEIVPCDENNNHEKNNYDHNSVGVDASKCNYNITTLCVITLKERAR